MIKQGEIMGWSCTSNIFSSKTFCENNRGACSFPHEESPVILHITGRTTETKAKQASLQALAHMRTRPLLGGTASINDCSLHFSGSSAGRRDTSGVLSFGDEINTKLHHFLSPSLDIIVDENMYLWVCEESIYCPPSLHHYWRASDLKIKRGSGQRLIWGIYSNRKKHEGIHPCSLRRWHI